MKKQYLAVAFISFVGCLHAEDAKKEDSSVVVREETIGNVKVTAQGRNIDEASQHRLEWKRNLKKHRRESQKKAQSEEKEREDDSTQEVSVTFKWPAKD